MNPFISIVHATARPLGWQAVYAQHRRQASDFSRCEYILAVDEAQVEEFTPLVKEGIRLVVNKGRRCYVDAANAGAAEARGRVLVMASDDMFPPQDWDAPLFERYGHKTISMGLTEEVIRVGDGGYRDDIMCMQILSHAWYERYGFVFDPEFESMFADDDYTARAERDGVIVDLRPLSWKHEHHRNGQRQPDAVDVANEDPRRYADGAKAFRRNWPERWAQRPNLLNALYEQALATPSDIQEHLETLKSIAAGQEILELGVRRGMSTTAFLAGRPRRLMSIDHEVLAFDPQLKAAAELEGIEWDAVKGDSRQDYGEFDIVFIDTLHTAAQVRAELATHASRARQFLVFHDSVTNAERGEDGGPGIMEPIKELMAGGRWREKAHYLNNNGLLILERIINVNELRDAWDRGYAGEYQPQRLMEHML